MELFDRIKDLRDTMRPEEVWKENNEILQNNTNTWKAMHEQTNKSTEPFAQHLETQLHKILALKKAFDKAATALHRIFEVNSLEPIESLLNMYNTKEANSASKIDEEMQKQLDSYFQLLINQSSLFFTGLHKKISPILKNTQRDIIKDLSLEQSETTFSDSREEQVHSPKLASPKWVTVQSKKEKRGIMLSRSTHIQSVPALKVSPSKIPFEATQDITETRNRAKTAENLIPGQSTKNQTETQQPEYKAQEKQVTEALDKSSSSGLISKTLKVIRGIERMQEKTTLTSQASSKERKPKKTSQHSEILASGAILPLLKKLEENDEICFDFNPIEPDMPSVRYATVEKLIERITLPDLAIDIELKKAFFLTFPSFSSASEILQLFADRLEKANQLSPGDCARIILRTASAIKMWIEYYPDDFKPETFIRIQTDKITNSFIAELFPDAATLIRSALPNKESQEEQPVVTRTRALRNSPAIALNDFSVLQPDRICFAVLPALEVARQLTLLASGIFCKLKPQEFATKNWCSEDKNFLSPNVMQIIEQFNKISNWAMTEILRPIQLKKRTKIFKKIIQVAMHFREFNNFHGLMAILSGLQSSPVKRLNQTWAELSDNESEFIAEILKLMSFVGSYKEYRAELKSLEEHELALPFIGIFLTDLVYIEDGNPSFVAPKKINFIKFKLIASVTQQILGHRMKYSFTEIPAIFQWFSEMQVVGEEEGYLLSTKIEPRNTSEALETLLMTEANLLKELEQIKVRNDVLEMRESEHVHLIDDLTLQMREQRKMITLAQDTDQTLLKRYSIRVLKQQDREESTPDVLDIQVTL